MATRRRKVWIITGLAVLLCAVAVGIGLRCRHYTKYPDLYRLASAVGVAKPRGIGPVAVTAGSGTALIILRSSATSRTRYTVVSSTRSETRTVLVIPKEHVAEARAAITRYFPNPVLSYSSLRPVNNSIVPIVDYRSDGKSGVLITSGAPAEEMAKDAGLTLPKDALVIATEESPDWFTLKIQQMLKYLHLR